jgi:DUF971 family protein/molybdopterin converting factor small subunit
MDQTSPDRPFSMTEKNETPAPTGINFHQKSRLLEISFTDGTRFNFPCEYLRVYSPGTQAPLPVHGKAGVNITDIKPEGQDALQLAFDDGHCESYSWPYMHALGQAYEKNWAEYLQRLSEANLTRGDGRDDDPDGTLNITVHYFIQLAEISGKDQEDLLIPASVTNVQTLLAWLRKRGPAWAKAFNDDQVQVTVNKQFAELFTLIEAQDEVAIVPAALTE